MRETTQDYTNDLTSVYGQKEKMIQYADLHCDTLTVGRYLQGEEKKKRFWEREGRQISLQKLIKGGCAAQVFALFSRSTEESAWEDTLYFLNEFKRGKEVFTQAGIKPVFAIEDGGSVENDLERVKFLIDEGAKIFGITWNDENCLGFPCGREGGLKPFGKQAVEYLLFRGVYPDLSHLSDQGIADTLSIAENVRFPVVATHSLSREICPHKRNLTDEQIRRIADLGGVIGVNFEPSFIGVKGLFAHIEHILRIGGEDVLAIGTDFDGIESPVYSSAEQMQTFFADMKKAGFSARITEKLAYQNACRLLDF